MMNEMALGYAPLCTRSSHTRELMLILTYHFQLCAELHRVLELYRSCGPNSYYTMDARYSTRPLVR